MEPKINPSVFAAGCPLSGATLFQGMSDAHPNTAAASDPHSIPELVRTARAHRGFHHLGLSGEAFLYKAAGDSGAPPEFGGALRAGGEKTPDYVKGLPLYHALFPRRRGRCRAARRKEVAGSRPSA